MGMSIPAFLIVVQSTVQRHMLGIATSTIQFTRTIGGTVGVSVMGAVLSLGLATQLSAAGLDPATVSVDNLLEGLGAASSADLATTLREALALATQNVFLVSFIAAALGRAIENVSMPWELAVPARPLVMQTLTTHRVLDTSRIRVELGYADRVPAREALANTAWSVITPGGDVIKESIGAFPRVVLSEGEYRAIARNEGKVFERPFNVVNGVDGEVEVVAR